MFVGDQEFTRLYNEHFPAIFRFVLREIGHREEAENLTQEIFRKIYRRDVRYPKAYLWKTARNAVKQHWGKKKKRKIISLDSCADGHDATAGQMLRDLINSGDLPTDAELRETQEYIRTIVRALPVKERAVIELRHLDGEARTRREIAECLGCSEPTARTTYRRAIERLRNRLAHDLEG